MLIERKPKPAVINVEGISSRSSGSFSELLEVFKRVIAISRNNKFLFVDLYYKAGRFLVERVCSLENKQQRKNNFLHFLGLLFLCVSLLNVDTFSACSAADCNLYESPEYQGCSPTSGNNQYQCGGGSGSCSDVCGGCGWRIRTSGYQQHYQHQLDSLCWLKMTSAGLSCSLANSKCTGLKPLRTIAIGLCGVGYESDFDVETICTCVERSSSSSKLSSSSSAPSSSSSYDRSKCKTAQTALSQHMCSTNYNGSTNCYSLASWCSSAGYPCGYSWDFPTDGGDGACFHGAMWTHLIPSNDGQHKTTLGGCITSCPSSSVEVSSSSISFSSDVGSSSDDTGGGGSGGGESSSGSGGGDDSGSGGGGTIPCGWGDYPPCIVDPIDPPFCQMYPELCYQIGGIDDSISRYGSAIADSLGRLIGRLDSLGSGGSGSCLDSANCESSSWSGDSIPYVEGDTAYSPGAVDTSGSNWVRSILSAATIPQASRTCPKIPSANFDLLGRPYKLEYNICGEEFNIGGRHVLQLVGEILRAVCGLLAVFIVLGAISSFNAGLHKMRILGK